MTGVNPQIKQSTLDGLFLTGPSESLVLSTLGQMALVPGMIKLFGPYKAPTGKATDDNQRWADYQRFDWSIRQLPAISVYESNQAEAKDSDQAWLRGMVSIMVVWPPNFRRPDARRIEVAFKGVLQNFYASQLVADMLDELYYIQRPAKVPGLNEYGKTMTWTPNVNTIVENEACPVTMVDVNYRIDLRAWYRALEFQGRTKEQPFEVTLADLATIGGLTSGYDGIDDEGVIQVTIPDEIDVTNP